MAQSKRMIRLENKRKDNQRYYNYMLEYAKHLKYHGRCASFKTYTRFPNREIMGFCLEEYEGDRKPYLDNYESEYSVKYGDGVYNLHICGENFKRCQKPLMTGTIVDIIIYLSDEENIEDVKQAMYSMYA